MEKMSFLEKVISKKIFDVARKEGVIGDTLADTFLKENGEKEIEMFHANGLLTDEDLREMTIVVANRKLSI